jgi:hypothetical protein
VLLPLLLFFNLISFFFNYLIIYIFIDSKDFDYILDDRSLNINYFLNLRQYHDAYSDRKLERKKVLLKDNDKNDSEIDINKASNLLSYLTKNDIITTSKSQENRWKSNKETDNKISEKENSLGKFGIFINLFFNFL